MSDVISLRKAWALRLTFIAVILIAVIRPDLPYKTITTEVCPVSGATRIRTYWLGIPVNSQTESTPLHEWLLENQTDFEPEYRERTTSKFYFSARRRVGIPPFPIEALKPEMTELLSQLSSGEIESLVDQLKTGTEEEQRDAVKHLLGESESGPDAESP